MGKVLPGGAVFQNIILAGACLLLGGCSNVREVSPTEFQSQFEQTQEINSAYWTTYLGEKDGLAYLQQGRVNYLGGGATNKIIFVKLDDLDATFRRALPKKILTEVPEVKQGNAIALGTSEIRQN